MTDLDTGVRSPTTGAERTLAPDLARGLMLLLIALANTPYYLYGQPTTTMTVHAPDGSAADRVVQAVIITAVDLRTYPMFAFLFGYGIVQLYLRQTRSGTAPTAARRLLRRRHWWLVVFGLAHAALLWMGDILVTYGLVGLVLVALFFRRSDRTLLTWALVLTGLSVLIVLAGAAATLLAAPSAGAPPDPEFDPFALARVGIADPNYLTSIPARLAFVPLLVVVQGFFTLAVPTAVLLAMWAARRGILERPGEHLRLLRGTALFGITAGWLGGLVLARQHLAGTPVPPELGWFYSGLQTTTGLFCGVGYVALFGLVGHAYQRRRGNARGPVVRALSAVGQRSLSCYLAQSVLFAPLLSAWGFGLGAVLSSWSVALLAVAGWLLTVLLSAAQDRAGQRGPAELLLRRLAYGRQVRPAAPA